MNILDRALSIFGYTKAATVANPPRWASAHARSEEMWEPDRRLTETQNELYSRVSWVMTATDLVASVAASTALKVKQSDDDGNKDIDNHPFERLLKKPNPIQSRFEFLYETVSWYAFTGNSIWWLNRAGESAEPDEMWPIPPHRIRPVPDRNTFIRGYMYDAGDGIEIPIDAHEICHFKRFNPNNMYVGMSPLESLYNTAAADLAANRWNRNFFAKNNAKPTGVMTFADPIEQGAWDEIKSAVENEYGGVNRKLMMLRNVGSGAVNFIPTAFTHDKMQFLDLRKFSRDEIFNAIAPGSAAMVDVNATEANSKTGRDIFFSIGAHPKLKALGEKISAEVLPAYGRNLVCEFDDVRQRDVALELTQISTFSQTHTIDEVRAEWYSDEPLPDERGDLLLAEIGTQAAGGGEDTPSEEVAEPEAPEADGEIKALLSEISAELQSVKAQMGGNTGITVEQIGAALKSSEGAPETYGATTITLPTEPGDVDELKQIRAELDLWQKKDANRKRKGRKGATQFESAIIPNHIKAFVELGLSRGDGGIFEAAKRVLLLDDDDDEAEQKFRLRTEQQATDKLAESLEEQRQAVLRAVEADPDNPDVTIPDKGGVADALRAALIEAVDDGVVVAIRQLEGVSLGFDWTLANTAARDWANQVAGERIQGINQTTRRQVQQAVSAWIQNGEPLEALSRELEVTFGQARAELIASTEVTDAYARGSQLSYIESGVVDEIEIVTSLDERVCPTCGPRHGERLPVDVPVQALPAFHPRCRCWIRPVIGE